MKKLVLSLAALALVFSSGCGYKLVRESDAALPSGVKSVSVKLVKNQTIEAGLEDVFTQELIRRLESDGRIDVRRDGSAEAGLECVITDLNVRPKTYSAQGRISVEEAEMKTRCKLVIPDSESVIWKTGTIVSREEYPVGNDYILNEEAKERAILEACVDTSESIRSRLLDSF